MISEGQARKYCYEDISLIENYALAIADKTQTWDIHHRVEDIMNCGPDELIAQGCYTDRPAHELIFLTKSEHRKRHPSYYWRGKHLSENHKKKLSESGKGKGFAGHKHSLMSREKMRSKAIGRIPSDESNQKRSTAMKSKKWFTNGIECKRSSECPGPGWKEGRGSLKRKS